MLMAAALPRRFSCKIMTDSLIRLGQYSPALSQWGAGDDGSAQPSSRIFNQGSCRDWAALRFRQVDTDAPARLSRSPTRRQYLFRGQNIDSLSNGAAFASLRRETFGFNLPELNTLISSQAPPKMLKCRHWLCGAGAAPCAHQRAQNRNYSPAWAWASALATKPNQTLRRQQQTGIHLSCFDERRPGSSFAMRPTRALTVKGARNVLALLKQTHPSAQNRHHQYMTRGGQPCRTAD